MPEAVYQVMTVLSALVAPLLIGTNLGLLHLSWMLVSGRLLGSRGALIPGLSAAGLTDRQVRRAWAAVGQRRGRSRTCSAGWRRQVEHRDGLIEVWGRCRPTAGVRACRPTSSLGRTGTTCNSSSSATVGG